MEDRIEIKLNLTKNELARMQFVLVTRAIDAEDNGEKNLVKLLDEITDQIDKYIPLDVD